MHCFHIMWRCTVHFYISVCSNNTYGSNCIETCECITENSEYDNQTCDTVTGECKCASNWEGETCNVDVNECYDSRICNELENTTCVNTIGSYVCDCKRGFVHSSRGICIEGNYPSYLVFEYFKVITFKFRKIFNWISKRVNNLHNIFVFLFLFSDADKEIAKPSTYLISCVPFEIYILYNDKVPKKKCI